MGFINFNGRILKLLHTQVELLLMIDFGERHTAVMGSFAKYIRIMFVPVCTSAHF